MPAQSCLRAHLGKGIAVSTLILGLAYPATSQDPASLLTLTPIRIQASNPVHGGSFIGFGSALDLDGEVLVVGAPAEDESLPGSGVDAGAVYIFERQATSWVERQKLRAPVQAAQERFGASVAIALGDEGIDFLIVGAPGGTGQAYIFHRINGGAWEHEITLTRDEGSNAAPLFGNSVGIDYHVPANSPTGDSVFVAAVGAPQNQDPPTTGNQAGSVTIFQRTGDPAGWSSSHEFFGSDHSEFYGRSVAIAAPGVIAGTEGLDEVGFNAGGARVIAQANFTGTVYHYSEETYFVSSDPVGNGQLGQVITVDYHQPTNDLTTIIGDPFDDTGSFDAGLVHVFGHSCGVGTTCLEDTTIQPPSLGSSANFGWSVALSSTLLATGAPGVGTDGTVFLYERGVDATIWNSVGELALPVASPPFSCLGGRALALQGLTLAVGCPTLSRYQEESVYIYDADGLFADGFESGNTSAW